MTTTAPTLIPAGTWAVDASHSSIGFAVKHVGIATVRGYFNEFQGSVEVGEDNQVSATGTIDVASVDTRQAQRDEHLRSPDFFDVANHPEITYRSTKVEPSGDDSVRVTGEITIRGIARELVLEAEVDGPETDQNGAERIGVSATGSLSRGDFDMKFNAALGGGNVLVSDKVKLQIDVSAVKS